MNKEIKRVVVVGAGGVGFWLAVALCRDSRGCEVVVYDDDTFEGGYGAQRLPLVGRPGTKKVDFLKGFVRMVMGDAAPTTYAQKLRWEDWLGFDSSTLVVDCTDMDLVERRALWDKCQHLGAQMLRVSYDGTQGGIVVVSRGLPLSGRPGGGYAEKPDLALSLWAGGVGAKAVLRVLDGVGVESQQWEFGGQG